MSPFFSKKAVCIGGLLLFLFSPITGYADPVTIVRHRFEEIGNDVKVTFVFQDLEGGAASRLPRMFTVCLNETSGFDRTVGMLPLTLRMTQVTSVGLQNGYRTRELELLFRNASNAATGTGSSYSLEVKPVPEPATLVLLGTGLAGVAIKMRKRIKSRKTGQGDQ